jgi:uncharacterized membrane protein YhaH (DUF805 family)
MRRLLPLFSFTGRVACLTYRKAFFSLGIVVGLLVVLEIAASVAAGVVGAIFLFLMMGPLLALLALTVRRLHDRNKSGWWLLLFWGGPGILVELERGVRRESLLDVLLTVAAGIPFIWGLVEISILPGTIGSNSYGEDPRGLLYRSALART